MKLKLRLLGFCLLAFPAMYINAQVTVGSGVKPEPYALLQIEGQNGGLRLSRLTLTERDALPILTAIDSVGAKGLTIYNTTDNRIEFFDGLSWRVLGSGAVPENGLNLSASGDVYLGGPLVTSTSIDFNAKNLDVTTGATGAFIVNENANGAALSVTSSDVKMTDLTSFNVSVGNDNRIKVAGKEVMFDGAKAGFHAGKDALTVGGDAVVVTGKLNYKDGNETSAGVATHVLQAVDGTGKAEWKEIPKTVTSINIERIVKPGDRITPDIINALDWKAITKDFSLTKGKWLILARFATYTRHLTDPLPHAALLQRLRLYSIDGNKTIHQAARMSERKGQGNEPNGAYAAPVMNAVVEVTADSENFRIDFATLKSAIFVPQQAFIQGDYFRAIKLDK